MLDDSFRNGVWGDRGYNLQVLGVPSSSPRCGSLRPAYAGPHFYRCETEMMGGEVPETGLGGSGEQRNRLS